VLKIVSGSYRSRTIDVPSSCTVPSKSIVRTAIANALGQDLLNAKVLDLFAGSGALGIEALSRGAVFCFFNDASVEASVVIKNNLKKLKEDKASVTSFDYRAALTAYAQQEAVFDIVFLDPPYSMKEVYATVPNILLDTGLLSPRGVVVLEFEGEITTPSTRFSFAKTYNYGRTKVLVLRR
jgi:16S rRNA (guanine966-N2)-methyltransferase